MSTLTRRLMTAATLAVIGLAGMIPAAHAQATDEPAGHHAGRPPTQGQVGEAWRQRSVGSRHDKAAEATLGRLLARERLSVPGEAPAQTPAPAPAQPRQQPGWVLATIVALAVGLLAAGLAALAARRASRRAPPQPASPTR